MIYFFMRHPTEINKEQVIYRWAVVRKWLSARTIEQRYQQKHTNKENTNFTTQLCYIHHWLVQPVQIHTVASTQQSTVHEWTIGTSQ